MNRFEYTDHSGDKLVACPTTLRDGTPIVAIRITEYDIVGPSNWAVVHLPTAVLEEVIAGFRDMARQAGGVTTAPRRRLTELEHDRAWHAIEGAAGEPGADPGSVLAAVLRALDIDPPAETRTPLAVIAGTRPPAGDPACQCLPATPTVDAAHCDNCAAEGNDEASLVPEPRRRTMLIGEISVPLERALRARGHTAAADEIVYILLEDVLAAEEAGA